MKRILKRITILESALRYFDADGNLTDHGNLRGDVDDAKISQEERKKGIRVEDLISE